VRADGEITTLLAAMRSGDREAEEHLIGLVYKELHSLARRYMWKERADHTLQPTALVHETYLRLLKQHPGNLQNRAHFFATAATVMRRILVDHARKKAAARRSGGGKEVELREVLPSGRPDFEQLLALDELLTRLAQWDARQARVVEMVYFGGLTEEEAAVALNVSVRTVRRDWRAARAWLQSQIGSRPE